jgi:hypothetical protein
MIMSEYKDEAVALLEESTEKFDILADKMARNINNEDFDSCHLAYLIAAEMDVRASQLSGEVRTVEGKCNVDNACAKVVIGDVSVRGNIQFEVEIDGEWYKGHCENSQYGLIFCAFKAGKGSVILTSDYNGRVTFPLTMDE